MTSQAKERAREALSNVSFIDDDYDEEHRERAVLAIERALLSVRNEALDEAAKVAEDCEHAHSCEGPMIARSIRQLKSESKRGE